MNQHMEELITYCFLFFLFFLFCYAILVRVYAWLDSVIDLPTDNGHFISCWIQQGHESQSGMAYVMDLFMV